MNFKNFIYYSTILSIFTETLRYNLGFDIKFFYFVIFFNVVAFIVFKKLKYTKGLLVFHSIILLSGLISCTVGYNSWGYFFVQLFFLMIIPTYYYSFFSFFKDKFEDIVNIYCKLCFIIAVMGFITLPFDIASGQAFHSIMLEPAHYCTIILPAFFITLKDLRYPRYYNLVILTSIILTGSSLGYLGLGICVLLYAKNISVWKSILAFSLVLILGIVIYITYSPFRLRVEDTAGGIANKDLTSANLSTYALLSNLFVSTQSFLSNPIMGNGVGSHTISRSLYLKNVEGIEVFEKMDMDHLNAQDAGSLFSRLMSELGLIGIIGVLYFIAKFYIANDSNYLTINVIVSRAILLYFFAKLFREGHYFSPEMYFFVFLYVFNKYNRAEKLKIST